MVDDGRRHPRWENGRATCFPAEWNSGIRARHTLKGNPPLPADQKDFRPVAFPRQAQCHCPLRAAENRLRGRRLPRDRGPPLVFRVKGQQVFFPSGETSVPGGFPRE